MIKEVLVVEGKMDVVAIDKAVEADCIMTDPDSAGERIRRFLTKRFPEAKHAFIPKEDATANNDIGIEQASPEAIRTALAKVRTMDWEPTNNFTGADLLRAGISGSPAASDKRAKLGAVLGIGYANAKTFLQRLNHYGITRQEFQQAVAELEK